MHTCSNCKAALHCFLISITDLCLGFILCTSTFGRFTNYLVRYFTKIYNKYMFHFIKTNRHFPNPHRISSICLSLYLHYCSMPSFIHTISAQLFYLHDFFICMIALSLWFLYLHWSSICMSTLSAWALYLHWFSIRMGFLSAWVLFMHGFKLFKETF